MGVKEDLLEEFDVPAKDLRVWLLREEPVLKDMFVRHPGYITYRRVVKVHVLGKDRLVSFEDMSLTRRRNRKRVGVTWEFDPSTLAYETSVEDAIKAKGDWLQKGGLDG